MLNNQLNKVAEQPGIEYKNKKTKMSAVFPLNIRLINESLATTTTE